MQLENFIRENASSESRQQFELENSKLLDIAVNGTFMTKAGSMISYTGDLTFTGKSNAEGGVTGFIKDQVSSEGTPVMEVEGQGHVYVADNEKKIQLLSLDQNESISVNGNDVLAFSDSVEYKISTIGSVGAAQAGGLTNVFLSGPGVVAITTHGEPLVLGPPVRTDPDATVAWSSNLSPSINVNRSLSDSIGQSSGETYQMDFNGSNGFVVVQAFEETSQQA